MANQPDPNKIQRAIRVPRELDVQILKKYRIDSSHTVKDAYILALMDATRNVILTAKDHKQIAKAIKEAKCKRKQ